MEYKVKNINLANTGLLKLELSEQQMPVLSSIKNEFKKTKPFKGLRIAACLHITKETGILIRALKEGGAKVSLTGSNPLSTQDDISSALAKEGINIYAWRGQSNKDYYWCLNKALELRPNVTIDDGADLISMIHSTKKDLLKNIFAGQEETTTGVIRLRAMAQDGALKYPVVAVNDTPTKRMFDNVYGTGQSTMDGILRATSAMITGKIFVVAGYGYCGSGIAERARGMGANVIVTEINPTKALKALMDGFRVMQMTEAAKIGDIFITATGDKNVIVKKHFQIMKNGAILANSGHFNVEISLPDLKSLAKSERSVRENMMEYTLNSGKKIYLLAEGRLVNLAAAEGHPSSVMDMSFANHALVCEWIIKNYKKLEPKVYDVPKEIDEKIAQLKLKSTGTKIDKLTKEQKEYLGSWHEGT